MSKPLLSIAALVLAVLASHPAQAHGIGAPRHGGAMSATAGTSFELVASADGAAIYLSDHDMPVSPSGLTGKLTVLNGEQKSEAGLVAVGDRLEAKGIKLAPGAIVVAVLRNAGGQSVTVRFAYR
jgi:hypothetical protein